MSEFLAMGGYGFYVWGAYGVAALAHRRRDLVCAARAAPRRAATPHDAEARARDEAPPSPLRLIAAGVAVLGVAVALVLNAFQSNLVFFFTPSQVVAQRSAAGPAVSHRRHGRSGSARARTRTRST